MPQTLLSFAAFSASSHKGVGGSTLPTALADPFLPCRLLPKQLAGHFLRFARCAIVGFRRRGLQGFNL
ncbi:MAG: hypothetical protein LUG87_05950, partial [Oscillospiraceae bacterium]|nr:hypothetical protein [Oscillospiraceae bacterium]